MAHPINANSWHGSEFRTVIQVLAGVAQPPRSTITITKPRLQFPRGRDAMRGTLLILLDRRPPNLRYEPFIFSRCPIIPVGKERSGGETDVYPRFSAEPGRLVRGAASSAGVVIRQAGA